jgi:hypothetical protein
MLIFIRIANPANFGKSFAFGGDCIGIYGGAKPPLDVASPLRRAGVQVYQARKDADTATSDLSRPPVGVYIVTGSSGWNRKIMNSE